MTTYNLPPFGELHINALEDYYEAELEYDGKTITLDLNFNETEIEGARLEGVKLFLDQFPLLFEKATLAIKDDVTEGDTVNEYLDHHLNTDIVSAGEMALILKDTDESIPAKERLLSLLHLVRIGFYPEYDDNYAVMDFTIGRDITQYLVVVNVNTDGAIESIVMES